VESRDGRLAQETGGARISRLQAATLNARGVIAGIANCGRDGVLAPESVRELNDLHLYRVELLLESASTLQRSAQLIRLLAIATERIGWLKAELPSASLVEMW
jgi:hypothetical protein